MTVTLQIEVPDNGSHTIMVTVTERPQNPFLADQHVSLRREVWEVDPDTKVLTRIK